ncbi:hypothetical protein AB0B48_00490 [Micromonospora sp. NPDC049089]|uniref:hypothetical protein n=1 Tax=Micromonospora sp. NPDC049089 TaxID=3155496 RepID=UPI0033ECCD46
MLTESLLALASIGGAAIAEAMATDAWTAVKSGVLRVMRRDTATTTSEIEYRLDDSASTLDGLSGAELESARAILAIAWRARLENFLARYPDSANDLQAALAIAGTQISTQVQQHVAGYGNSRQAVQGHGVQNVNFS